MEDENTFNAGFDLLMQSEVGPWFDGKDLETQQGLCETKAQRRKVGYVNHAADPGGETKFGVAQNKSMIKVSSLTLEDARMFYQVEFWEKYKCNALNPPIGILLFDAAVNHGGGQAIKFLQRAARVNDDGRIGPQTISIANAFENREVCYKMLDERKMFFIKLSLNKPDLKVFLNGWLARVELLREFTKSWK